jgi:UDP-N-acetylmuramoylalanine--D-glutamate ligase
VAVLLNFSPNHLDWHADMEEYLSAKLKIFAMQGRRT